MPSTAVFRPAVIDGPGQYKLMGIISHMGSNTACGHYVAHVKKVGGRDGCREAGGREGGGLPVGPVAFSSPCGLLFLLFGLGTVLVHFLCAPSSYHCVLVMASQLCHFIACCCLFCMVDSCLCKQRSLWPAGSGACSPAVRVGWWSTLLVGKRFSCSSTTTPGTTAVSCMLHCIALHCVVVQLFQQEHTAPVLPGQLGGMPAGGGCRGGASGCV